MHCICCPTPPLRYEDVDLKHLVSGWLMGRYRDVRNWEETDTNKCTWIKLKLERLIPLAEFKQSILDFLQTSVFSSGFFFVVMKWRLYNVLVKHKKWKQSSSGHYGKHVRLLEDVQPHPADTWGHFSSILLLLSPSFSLFSRLFLPDLRSLPPLLAALCFVFVTLNAFPDLVFSSSVTSLLLASAQ